MNLCVIPARGGSKRIPRKNIREFCGKPMIAYAIEAARSTLLFEHILVSTEDKEIAEIANQYGAETPFQRYSHLADDYTPTVPVIRHAIHEAERLGFSFQDVCCIYPAVPLLKSKDIVSAQGLLRNKKKTYSLPIIEFPSAVQRAFGLSKSGKLKPFYPEYELERSQDLKSAYYDAGQFYWADKHTWNSVDHIHANGVGLVISAWSAVDIDTPDDWHFAEFLYETWRKKNEE